MLNKGNVFNVFWGLITKKVRKVDIFFSISWLVSFCSIVKVLGLLTRSRGKINLGIGSDPADRQ